MKQTYLLWYFRRFFRRCRNVIRWIPTLWKDEDWDDSFVTTIFIKKLEHQRDFFLSDRTHILEAKKVAAEIQTAIDGLRNTAESYEYESRAIADIERKWGESKMRSEPSKAVPGCYEIHFDVPGVKTPEDEAQYNAEFRECMAAARKQYMKDKRAAYAYIASNIDRWWD